MATATLTTEPRPAAQRTLDVEIVIPVYNEEAALELSVRRLHRYLCDHLPFSWQITVADNASRDATWAVACRLTRELDRVRAIHLEEKGRGRALRAAWSASQAGAVAYMDVDLSTGLDAILPLVAPVLSGHSDLAIGTRLSATSRVVRGPRRETISRIYNVILRSTLGSRFSDAQCGFKAMRSDTARRLLPLVEDNGWFFDTELLVLAERRGLRIHEVPVDWVDDPDSRVDIVRTAVDDLKGVWRLVRHPTAAPATPRARRFTMALLPLILAVAALAAVRLISPATPSLLVDIAAVAAANGVASAARLLAVRRSLAA